MSTTPKHTPGPWEVHLQKDRGEGMGPKGSHYEILHPIVNEEGEHKGKLGGYHVVLGDKNCLPGYILSEANARLIAAAPEMVSLLRSWLITDPYGIYSAKIEEVLAKVKGEK